MNQLFYFMECAAKRLQMFFKDPFLESDLQDNINAVESVDGETLFWLISILSIPMGLIVASGPSAAMVPKSHALFFGAVGGAIGLVIATAFGFVVTGLLGSRVTLKRYVDINANEILVVLFFGISAMVFSRMDTLTDIPIFYVAEIVFRLVPFYRILLICEVEKKVARIATIVLGGLLLVIGLCQQMSFYRGDLGKWAIPSLPTENIPELTQ